MPLAGAENQLFGCVGQRGAAAHDLRELGVVVGVADQDAAEQTRAIFADDELLVDALHEVLVEDARAARRVGERIAEACYVDAEELELRGEIRALEARRAVPGENAGQDARHFVAGRDEAVEDVGVQGAFTDGADGGVARA